MNCDVKHAYGSTTTSYLPCVFLKPHRVGGTFWRRGLENAYQNSLDLKDIFGREYSFIKPGDKRLSVLGIGKLEPPYMLFAIYHG